MKKNQTKKKYKLLANLILITILVSSSIAVGEKITEKDTRLEKEENSFINQVVADLTEPLKDYPNISISSSGLVIDGLFYEFDEIQEPKLVERTVKSRGNGLTIIEETVDGAISLKNDNPRPGSGNHVYLRMFTVYSLLYGFPQFYTRAMGFFIFLPTVQVVFDLSTAKSLRWGWDKTYFDSWTDISIAGGYVQADARFQNVNGPRYQAWAKVFCLSDGTTYRYGDIYQI